jgi:microcystin-dependent protein
MKIYPVAVIISLVLAASIGRAYAQAECSTVADCAQKAVVAAKAALAAASAAIPKGAVLAFRTETCPAGWIAIPELSGRVIVGAGVGNKDEAGHALTPRKLGDAGGEEKHQLTVAELAKHAHGTQGYNGTDSDHTRRGDSLFTATNTRTQPEGGDQPHNVMQPYFVLTYCEKT